MINISSLFFRVNTRTSQDRNLSSKLILKNWQPVRAVIMRAITTIRMQAAVMKVDRTSVEVMMTAMKVSI